jgi:L-fucose isomerase-like protein
MPVKEIAFVSIIRTTFDVPFATEMTDRARKRLEQAGFALTGTTTPLTTLEEAHSAAQELAALHPDFVLIFQATFADSTMVQAIAQAVDAPLLLWAVPEALSGGRLRLNSLCGINLGGHALKRAGVVYDTLYAAPEEETVLTKIESFWRAARTRTLLKGARFGRVGEHPAGFETCAYDAPALQERFGVDIVPIDLREGVFEQARAISAEATAIVKEQLATRVDGLEQMQAEPTHGTLSAYLTMQQIAKRDHLNGFAVRCWPEFFTELGCAACGAMSLLSDEMTPASCEADVNGTITQYMLQSISGAPAFGCDIVALDAELDTLVLWHCGLAPLSMANPDQVPGVTIHSNRKLPLLMEFTLKPGTVTLARLSHARGSYTLVIGKAEMIAAPPAFSGTSGRVRFSREASAVLDTILSEGLEHHVSLTYGDHVTALLALAHMFDLPVVQL